MRNGKCIAMLLAGGEGKRLAPFTQGMAKPAISFGAEYRIIDFSLSNCMHSGITTVGVLTQYQPLILNDHVGIGRTWDMERKKGGLTILSPHLKQTDHNWYKGTANAIFQNINFIEKNNPEYILVISGDHIYEMDYSKLLNFHIEKRADITVAVRTVNWADASRFGIMDVDDQNLIVDFEEKPNKPKSNLASMGIYIFNWKTLKEYLIQDELNKQSTNDFGKDIIPNMLKDKQKAYAYPFKGYWRDVGTIESFYDAHMDLLEGKSVELYDEEWPIYTADHNKPPTFVGSSANIISSLLGRGVKIFGKVEKSVIFYGAEVAEGSLVTESIIMPGAKIGKNAKVYKTIVGGEAVIEDGVVLGDHKNNQITIVDHHELVKKETDINEEEPA